MPKHWTGWLADYPVIKPLYYVIAVCAFDLSSLCCQCGTPIEPNPANMCVGCLRTQVDITEDIAKQGHLYFCKFCERLVCTVSHHTTTRMATLRLRQTDLKLVHLHVSVVSVSDLQSAFGGQQLVKMC